MSNPPIPPALTDVITPALSPSRWNSLEDPNFDLRIIKDEEGNDVKIGLMRIGDQARHALAALCLYEQPYGFTPDDAHDLDICLLGREPLPGTHLHRIKLLRDKILALLPPHHP